MARTRRRLSIVGTPLPLPVRVSGDFKTLREIEDEGDCSYCGSHRRTLYSYEDGAEGEEPGRFCNKTCYNDFVYADRPLAPPHQVREVISQREARKGKTPTRTKAKKAKAAA